MEVNLLTKKEIMKNWATEKARLCWFVCFWLGCALVAVGCQR